MVLHKSKDPIGQAIIDYQNSGKSEKLWVNSDITDKDEIPVSYLFRDYNKMPNIEQKALKLCNGSVLDVGAAAGSHSLWLKDRGVDTTSVDISELAVKAMRKRGVPNALTVDFFEISTEQKYDTLLFLMNGAGIAGTLSNLPTLLDKCSKLLKSGGQILIDSSDINYMFDDEDEKPQGKYYGEVEYTMSYGNVVSEPFSWLFVGFEMLKIVAQSCGFMCDKIIEGDNFDYLARLYK